MATHAENNECEEREWDMIFQDPFSFEEDELVYCGSSVSQPAVTRTGYFTEDHLAAETLNDGLVPRVNTVVTASLQTMSHTGDHKTETTEAELSVWEETSQHHQSEVNVHSSTTVLADGSSSTQTVNEPVTSCGKRLSQDSDAELNSSEVSSASSEEQMPIPVMLSSAKRFCANENVQNTHAAKHTSAYFRLPPPPTSPVRYAQPVYPPVAYNIPAWTTVSLSLPVNNSAAGLQVRPMVPYNNCVPYSVILPQSANISVWNNQSSTAMVKGTAAALWPGPRLQDILSKPPPSLPVSHAAGVGLPAVEKVPVPHLHNGLASPRLLLPTVPRVVPPFPPPNNGQPLSTLTHSTVLPQSHNAVKSGSPVNSNVSVSTGPVLPVGAQQPLPSSTATTTAVSARLSSPALPKSTNSNNAECSGKGLMTNDKVSEPTEQQRPADTLLSTEACIDLRITNVCPPSVSPQSASKQTMTPATSTSHSNIPSPRMKVGAALSQLDPRVHSGNRQNGTAAAQSRSAANTASTPATAAFIVPVPPPLPSLEELTADTEDKQKDVKAVTVSVTSQSAASTMATTDSVQLDTVQVDRTEAVAEQVRASLKPFFKSGTIDRDAYKEIMRKAVPKICASRSADISTTRVQSFIDAYVAKVTNSDRRRSGGSSSSGSTASRHESL